MAVRKMGWARTNDQKERSIVTAARKTRALATGCQLQRPCSKRSGGV
jgi:hypothetical protein